MHHRTNRGVTHQAHRATVLAAAIAAMALAATALLAAHEPAWATDEIDDPELVCPDLTGPEVGGTVRASDRIAWFSAIEGGVMIAGSTGRFSSLASAECGYSDIPVAAPTGSSFPGFAEIEVRWATPNTLEHDRRRACLMEESFRNGVGVVRADVAAYAVYSIDSPAPFDPAPLDAAARELLAGVVDGAQDCDGVEAPAPTPLPPLLAEAFAPLADPTPSTPSPPEPPAAPGADDPSLDEPIAAPATDQDAATTAPWYRWPLRIVGIAAMAVSLVLLARTFARIRRETPVHPLLDVGAIVVTLAVAVVMLALFPITADARWIVAAVAVGGALGWWQGSRLTVRRTTRGWAARRTGWAIVAFATGTVVAQVAGYLDRAGIIALGIALSFMSAAITTGLVAGRHPKLGRAPGAAAGSAVLAVLALGLTGTHLGAPAEVEAGAATAAGAAAGVSADEDADDPALEALIDMVDWSETMIVGGLFSEYDKPPVLVPASRVFGEPPEPVRSTAEWTATYRGEERAHTVDETYTFALRADGGCCSILYSGTGTVESEFTPRQEHVAEGRLHDVQIAAVDGFVSEPSSGLPSQGLVPFGEVRNLVRWVPGEPTVPPLSRPETCGRMVGETRMQHELERSDGQGAFDTYLVNGTPAEPRRNDLDSILIIPCEIPGFTVDAALDTAPPPPPPGDPSRDGGCPVRQEVIGALAPANQLPGVVTRTTGELFHDPNAPLCSEYVSFGQGGPGGARHELSFEFTRPTDEGWSLYSLGTDELLWADLPLPGELPEGDDLRCGTGADGLPLEPADPELGCTETIRHRIDDVRIHIWTDWQTRDGPNVLVFVTAPWGSYSYRCHYCLPTDPGVLAFIAAANQMAVDAAHQIETAPSPDDPTTPTDPPTDPSDAPADPTDDGRPVDPMAPDTVTGEAAEGLEAAPLAALATLAGSAALYTLSRGGRRDDLGDDDLTDQPTEWDAPPRRDVPSWVNDPRPLSEIWAEEAAADAARHGGDLRWDPERNALTTPGLREADRLEQLQREGRDRWHHINTAIGPSGMGGLVDYLDHAEVHVVRADGEIDLDALARVEAAVERLGQLELGYQQAADYTMRDAAWDTVGEAARNPIVRIGTSMLLGPAADPVLQTIAMGHRADLMVREGATDREIRDALTDELVLYSAVYGGLSIAAMAGGDLIQVNAEEIRRTAGEIGRTGRAAVGRALDALPDDIARSLTSTGRDTVRFLDQLQRFGTTDVSDAWRRGLGNTWNHAGHTSRLAQLTATDPRLGQSVNELYEQIDRLGPSRTISPAHRPLSPVEQGALDLLRRDPAGYQEAVRQGLVPPEVHRTVNWARDRVVRDAIAQTVQDLGPRSGLAQIDITGTGANPLSVRASTGWTDVDLTAIGDPAAAEKFRQQFQRNLDVGFGQRNAARALDVTCFAGRSGSPSGFTDPALRGWLPVEANYTGQTIRVTDGGRAITGYQPNAAANQPIPRLPTSGGAPNAGARADVRRLITAHNTGRPPTSVLDDLRYGGKYAQRIWKIEQVGTGGPTPDGIRVLERMKADRHWVPSPDELRAAAEAYTAYTGLIPGSTP